MKTIFTIVAIGAACLFFASCLGTKTGGSTNLGSQSAETGDKAPVVSPTKNPVGMDEGLIGNWYLEEMLGTNGKPMADRDETKKKCLLRFEEGGKVSANSGRNTYTGAYSTKGESITFRAIVGTKAMEDKWGSTYATKFKKATFYRFEKQNLSLKLPNGERLIFSKKK